MNIGDKNIKENISVIFPQFNENVKNFKVIFSTPAIFEKGWLPKWIDEKTLIGEYNDLKLKLLAAAIGKPLSIGGFDMKKRMPKPMYKAIPAGSVYYFELLEGKMDNVQNIFHQRSISEIYPEQGFGIAYVGKVTNLSEGGNK